MIYFEDEINQIKNIIEELNQEITRVNGLLEDKKNNLYSSMHDSNNRIEDLLKLISEKIIILNNLFSEHDQEIDDIDVTKTIATENNNELTFYIHYNEFQEYFSKEKEYNELINERNPDNLNSTYNQLKKDLNKSSSDLETLKNKLGQINLAVDIINNKLDWITTNKNSIKIVPENEKYYVYVNNQKAKLSNLSTSQRNMISLCYFFTQINEGKEISELYSENGIFLVLDDPISSLDYSNRTGMMSLLRYEIGKILLSSENSRVLITSHDTSVIYDLEKIIQDINTERSISSSPVRNIKFETKQLLNISDTPIKSFDASKDYVRLFTNIFQFADGLYDNNENSIADLSIGNNIRKVLEAYSTFNLNKGIRYLSLEEKVLDKLPSDELKNYYKYDMIKFLLDVESHQEKRIQTFSGIYGLPNYPYSDKKKIAQDVIYFLYAIDELHVSYNIKNFNSETKRKIESWNPINRVD